jgi:hypothetical protein
MLSSGSGDQLCNPSAVLLWCWIFTVLFTGGLFLSLAPFPWGKVSDPSATAPLPPHPGCQHVVMVRCLFLNTAEPSDFGCCSLAQEVNFVGHYLLYFSQWLSSTCCQPSSLSSHLFTHGSWGDQLLALPSFSGVLSATLPPLLCVSFQFLVFFVGGQSAQGAMLVYPRGGRGNTV